MQSLYGYAIWDGKDKWDNKISRILTAVMNSYSEEGKNSKWVCYLLAAIDQ